jgi:hypothetical protein
VYFGGRSYGGKSSYSSSASSSLSINDTVDCDRFSSSIDVGVAHRGPSLMYCRDTWSSRCRGSLCTMGRVLRLLAYDVGGVMEGSRALDVYDES